MFVAIFFLLFRLPRDLFPVSSCVSACFTTKATFVSSQRAQHQDNSFAAQSVTSCLSCFNYEFVCEQMRTVDSSSDLLWRFSEPQSSRVLVSTCHC